MGFAVNGCNDPKTYPPTTYSYKGYSRHDVDQVFLDHDGFRTIYDDEEGFVHQNKYSTTSGLNQDEIKAIEKLVPEGDRKKIKMDIQHLSKPASRVVIIKDLPYSTPGFCQELEFEGNGYSFNGVKFQYAFGVVEIHLPKDQNLSPGNETYGGRQNKPYIPPTNTPMHEVR